MSETKYPACCGSDAESVSMTCCGSGAESASVTCCEAGTAADQKRLRIEYLYLDLDTCNRCVGTDAVLDAVVNKLRPALSLAGYDVEYEKIEIETPELAAQYHFLSSPTILVNGTDIFGKVKESECACCGEIAGTRIRMSFRIISDASLRGKKKKIRIAVVHSAILKIYLTKGVEERVG